MNKPPDLTRQRVPQAFTADLRGLFGGTAKRLDMPEKPDPGLKTGAGLRQQEGRAVCSFNRVVRTLQRPVLPPYGKLQNLQIA